MTFDGTEPQQLVDALIGVEVYADLDPAQVGNRLPGAWVSLDEVRVLTLAGALELRCSVWLIAPDLDPSRALRKLAPMLTQLLTVMRPDGPVVTQGVVLPGDTTALPAMRVPLYLTTD